MGKKGITLVEIIITVAILGMVSLLFLSIFTNSHRLIVNSGTKSKELISSQDDIETLIGSQGPGTFFSYQMDFPSLPSMTIDGVTVSDGTFETFLPGVTNLITPVTGVVASETNLVFSALGDVLLVTAVVLPSDATNQNVLWTSNNIGIATVTGGIVKSINYGNATITVTTEEGGFTDTVSVLVSSTVLSSDSSLIALNYNGTLVDGFSPSVFVYNQDNVGNTVPIVTATVNHPSATYSVLPASGTTGQEVDRTTTVVVTAEDGSTSTYKIIFKKGGS